MGWTMEDTITLVVSKSKYQKVNDIPQAYLVNPKSKNSLESAKMWAKEYDIYTLENGGFKLKILSAAGSSSQGGKLSFWNCELSKDNLNCVIGINSEFLCSLLLHNQFAFGECLETVFLARFNSNVAAITDTMPEYKIAREYMQLKKSRNQKKTAKWVQGHNYVTATLDSLYVADVYTPLVVKNDYSRDTRFVIDFNAKKKLITDYYDKSKDNLYDAICCLNSLYSFIANSDKCPSRQQGDFSARINENFDELFVNRILYLANDYLTNEQKKKYHHIDYHDLCVILQTINGRISNEAMKYFDIVIEYYRKHSPTYYLNYYYVDYDGKTKGFNTIAEALEFIKQIFNDNGFNAE